MPTVYPASIDNNQSLPRSVDNLTPVASIVVNRLRDTIIAIEATLGTNPAANYGSVAARLMSLENNFSNLVVISLAGDLGGTTQHPLVVGLQGNPVSNAQPAVGQALVWNGIAWVPGAPLPAFQILSLSGPNTLYEIGQALVNPIFNATYSTLPTVATFVDNKGNPAINVFDAPPPSNPPTTFTYPESYEAFSALDLPYSVVFTLTAGNAIVSTSSTFTATWGQRIFFGVGTLAQYTASPTSFVEDLTNQLEPGRTITFTENPGASQYIFFAWPSNLESPPLGSGSPNFWINGFEGGFQPASPATVSITNVFNVTETYSVYRSDNPNLGNTLVYVF